MIVAITRLLYGKAYLGAVIRSTAGFADRHLITYTYTPSAGFGSTSLPCPDSRDELLLIAHQAAGKRLHWVEGKPISAMVAFDEFDDIDMLLELDSDEIPHQDLLADIRERFDRGELTHKRYRLQMVHHWRSFRYVCRDPQRQLRLHIPNAPIDADAVYPEIGRYIHHMGYAINDELMRFKWAISVHRGDLRPDWWQTWHSSPMRLTDLYPVAADFQWNAEPFPDGDLPAALIGHPYRSMSVIK